MNLAISFLNFVHHACTAQLLSLKSAVHQPLKALPSGELKHPPTQVNHNQGGGGGVADTAKYVTLLSSLLHISDIVCALLHLTRVPTYPSYVF